MRPSILIKKIKTEAGLFYYQVSTVFGGIQCYIGIDPKQNRVLYFNNDILKNPIGIIDFNLKDSLIAIPDIELWVSNRVAVQAFQAIKKNMFPEEMIISN